MKKIIINLIEKISRLFSKVFYITRMGRLVIDTITIQAMDRIIKVNYNGESYFFTSPNYLNHWRIKTFYLKEPETLEWIDDNINKDSIFWDIGANIGLYSIYAAKTKNCSVYSFEPSVFNLELLSRNIYSNGLVEKITILPFPLTSSMEFSKLNLTTTTWGGAISSFGQNAIGHDGKIIKKRFEFKTIGLTIDSTVNLLNVPNPNYIKMDVDGIEHLILCGGINVLKTVKSVLIEINDDFQEQSVMSSKILKESGLKLSKKLHSKLVDDMPEYAKTYNQIWIRP
jgi:FkbM family methyltransferase